MCTTENKSVRTIIDRSATKQDLNTFGKTKPNNKVAPHNSTQITEVKITTGRLRKGLLKRTTIRGNKLFKLGKSA